MAVRADEAMDGRGSRAELEEMSAQHLATKLGQLSFYKTYFGRLIWVILSLLILLAGAIGAIAYMSTLLAQGRRDYFTVDPHGRITKIESVSQPLVTQGQLLERFNVCVSMANNYDFVNFQRQLNDAQECFTEEGWNQFATALNNSGTLKMVREQRLIVSEHAMGPPVISQKGLRQGIYTWEIQMPVQITYQGGQAGRNVVTRSQVITARVERTNENEYSVGIAQYVVEESK
ncbi:DotI/IcmL/TraM family protein [Xanthomonas euvesicatoria]